VLIVSTTSVLASSDVAKKTVHRFILPSEGVTCELGSQIRDIREPVEKSSQIRQKTEPVNQVHRSAKIRICEPRFTGDRQPPKLGQAIYHIL
jgi:hypothetical protein